MFVIVKDTNTVIFHFVLQIFVKTYFTPELDLWDTFHTVQSERKIRNEGV